MGRGDRRRSKDDDDDDDKSTSSREDDRRRHKSKRKDSRKRSRRDGDDDDEDDSRSKKKRRERKKSKQRKPSSDDDSSSSRKDSKKKRKKHEKKHKKKHDKKDRKKKKHKRGDSGSEEESRQQPQSATGNDNNEKLARNYVLADALHQLLTDHPTPAMAVDTLPLVLIKLGGGTSLDLRQMPDQSAAAGIQLVLKALEPFGVTQEEDTRMWKWPPGAKSKDERLLLRIVRTLLNEIGFTMEAIEKHHQQKQQPPKQQKQKELDADSQEEKKPPAKTQQQDQESDLIHIKQDTMKMLQSFQSSQNNNKEDNDSKPPSTLPGELGGLCNMILEGESIALDGLPDPKLRTALEGLFQQCGLELCEMEPDSDNDEDGDNDNSDNNKEMGYGLPETLEQQNQVKAKLLSVMKACETMAANPNTTIPKLQKGPMRMPAGYQAPPEESSDDEEGPVQVGDILAKRNDTAVMSKEDIKRQAELRARQLRGAVTGVDELMSTDPNQREEWMLVPGKFDFLSSIKAGNPMKSRTFAAKSKAERDDEQEYVDPKIQAEMNAIIQAHTDARGPTLVEQHRLNKEKERQAAAAGGGTNGQWNWNRDKDLDSGRRVDKNALNMVLGGANKDLKSKFHGGF
ncbi:expressed unknown protein [Seminavis robusta]|uniref:DUF3752 domain-containing protein n=1 Tax=Seminavis robusta TaxID=568900 RepID=A0A9N8E482_9STRA|nr:expressed unknown protein [Seminavis robusta]|eukprot:Sro647_g181000.1 n/a (626) ;mRNA; f:50484-52361